jgi:hypothetical protein
MSGFRLLADGEWVLGRMPSGIWEIVRRASAVWETGDDEVTVVAWLPLPRPGQGDPGQLESVMLYEIIPILICLAAFACLSMAAAGSLRRDSGRAGLI